MKYMCKECDREFTDSHNKRNICHNCRKPWKNCDGCGKRIRLTSSLCVVCNNRQNVGDKNSNWRGGKTKTSKGYTLIFHPGHPRSNKRTGYILEHIPVMEEKIGRYLLPEETVHHINGVKSDNRPENLELWSNSHPSGQRISDKVEWAENILRMYAPERLT